jgi:hypothetical protein
MSNIENGRIFISGKVLHTWKNSRGTHFKIKMVKTVKFVNCDTCLQSLNGESFQTISGNNIHLVQCFGCSNKEIVYH